MVAPPRSTRAISSARRAKSADRIEGTISTICGLCPILSQRRRNRPRDRARESAAWSRRSAPPERAAATAFVLLRFERAGGIDQQSAGRQRLPRVARAAPPGGACRSARSAGVSRHLISGLRPSVPVPEQGASTRMRSKRPREGQRTRAVQHHQVGASSGFSCARRWKCRSQATARTPASSACAVLLPGAAQRSRKRLPGLEAAAAARWIASRCPACGLRRRDADVFFGLARARRARWPTAVSAP